MNIINIYDRYCNNSFILLSNNRIFLVSIDNYINEILLETDDIIENVICTNQFDFIIIKNLNIFKLFIYSNVKNIFKLVRSLNYNINNIIRTNEYHEFIGSNQSIKIENSELWNILR